MRTYIATDGSFQFVMFVYFTLWRREVAEKIYEEEEKELAGGAAEAFWGTHRELVFCCCCRREKRGKKVTLNCE